LADSISAKPKLATKAAKEAVNLGALLLTPTVLIHLIEVLVFYFFFYSAYELPLSQGLDFEKRLFHLLFGTVSIDF
jgi:hypothetical protein